MKYFIEICKPSFDLYHLLWPEFDEELFSNIAASNIAAKVDSNIFLASELFENKVYLEREC